MDFELLAENLVQLERRCKASWENLKVLSKHETKSALKNKMADFLKDCTQRILILKVVHRRVVNRSAWRPALGPSRSCRGGAEAHVCWRVWNVSYGAMTKGVEKAGRQERRLPVAVLVVC